MILDIPPQTEQIITSIAHQQGQSVENFIIMSAYEKALSLTYMPNSETLQAIHELESGKGVKFDTIDDLMADLNA